MKTKMILSVEEKNTIKNLHELKFYESLETFEINNGVILHPMMKTDQEKSLVSLLQPDVHFNFSTEEIVELLEFIERYDIHPDIRAAVKAKITFYRAPAVLVKEPDLRIGKPKSKSKTEQKRAKDIALAAPSLEDTLFSL